MLLEELKSIKNYKIDSFEQFKSEVIEAVESTCHWKKSGDWLHDEYRDSSEEGQQCYRAIIIVMNDCFNSKTPTFRVGYKNISSVTVFDIFYTDSAGGGFVIDDINLAYDAIKSFFNLQDKKSKYEKGGGA